MQHEYIIDDKEGIVYVSIKGECSIRDLETVFLAATEDSAFSPDYNVLADLRKCGFKFRPDVMKEFFQKYKDRVIGGKGKSALLLWTAHETFIVYTHQKKTEDTRTTQLFATYEAAMNWLKVD